MREAEVVRKTGETDIRVSLALEGSEYELLANVKGPFDASTYDTLNNKELIFAVRSSDSLSDCSWYLGLEFTPWEYDYGWGSFWVPLEVAWAFDPADKRLTDLIVRDYNEYQTNPKRVHLTPPSVEKVGSMLSTLDDSYELTYCKENIAVCTKKYEYQKPGSYNYNTANNYPLMRLADFILCKAEILNELNGPTQEAIDLINRIRRRAFALKSPPPMPSQISAQVSSRYRIRRSPRARNRRRKGRP